MAGTHTRRGNTTDYGRSRTYSTWNKTGQTTARKTTGTASWNRGNYTDLRNDFRQKMESYRTLYTETQGPGGTERPSPTTLNTFAHWINKGAVIYRVSTTQLNRWSDSNRKCTTANAAKTVLWNKFGKTPIKAVCKSKSGSYLVATMPTNEGRYFKFPR